MNLKKLTVGVLVDVYMFNRKNQSVYPNSMESSIIFSLKKLVKKVLVFPFTSPNEFLSLIKQSHLDLVFNLTEEAHSKREMDYHICALMELSDIPFTGSGSKALLLNRDKIISKLIAASVGVKTPNFFIPSKKIVKEMPIQFPILVKPQFADSSEGITKSSLVHGFTSLNRKINELREAGFKDIICEEYIKGREIYVGIVANKIMPVKELIIRSQRHAKYPIATSLVKHNKKYRASIKAKVAIAKLNSQTLRRVEKTAIKLFKVLMIRDYGRIDLILTSDGTIYFVEGNPNPGLSPQHKSFVGIWSSLDYVSVIEMILRSALIRYKQKA